MPGNIRTDRQFKRRIVKNLQGQIIDWIDEADGGWIIRRGQIINQEKFNAYVQKEKDKAQAQKTITEALSNPDAFQNPNASQARNVTATVDTSLIPLKESENNSSKVDDLEKRIDGMEGKLDQILKALDK